MGGVTSFPGVVYAGLVMLCGDVRLGIEMV